MKFYSFLLLLLTPNSFFFFFNDTATTEIYTLSLHDALPIFLSPPTVKPLRTSLPLGSSSPGLPQRSEDVTLTLGYCRTDRKSTRLNSSHGYISYAVFCLKKKKKQYLRHLCQYLLTPFRLTE